ncbi:MAG: hypothetical protein WAV20_11930 [Blastocatellia bacterium]
MTVAKKQAIEAVAAESIEDSYPLSPLQQGILFHSLYDKEPVVDEKGKRVKHFQWLVQAAD